jgi:hypothetical protein
MIEHSKSSYDPIREALDFSWQKQLIVSACTEAIAEYQRPSVLYRPTLSVDGDQWCARYGPNLQEGVAGFGYSPELACRAFDAAWQAKLSEQQP